MLCSLQHHSVINISKQVLSNELYSSVLTSPKLTPAHDWYCSHIKAQYTWLTPPTKVKWRCLTYGKLIVIKSLLCHYQLYDFGLEM